MHNSDQFLFVQVACEQDEEVLELKNTLGLACSVIGLFICLFYINSLTVFKNTNIINDRIFDQQLITLGDYSVQGKIKREQWFAFKDTIKDDPDAQENIMVKFEEYLINEIQNWVRDYDRDKYPPSEY